MKYLSEVWDWLWFEICETLPGLAIIAGWTAGAMGGGYLVMALTGSEPAFVFGFLVGAVATPYAAMRWLGPILDRRENR